MPIDISNIEPLASKSIMFEKAMRRAQAPIMDPRSYEDMDIDLPPDLEWIQQDKDKLRELVSQMDSAILKLAKQVHEAQSDSARARALMEGEQALMFKQIQTLNSLLKKQVETFTRMENQIEQINLDKGNGTHLAIVGVIAGLASAVTLIVLAPFATKLVEMLL